MNGIRIRGSKSFIMGTFFFVFFTSLIFSTSNAWAKSELNLKEILDRVKSLEATVAGPNAQISDYEAALESLEATVAAQETRIAALEALLASVSIVDGGDTVRFTGVNVQIVNGWGYTNMINGLGNLIVGYNELRGESAFGGDVRSGSHNIVVGRYNNFGQCGGLVVGDWNEISGPWSSVSGGTYNTASNWSSSVSGGYKNVASGEYSSVSGGYRNEASGTVSSVSGGMDNIASGYWTSILGGRDISLNVDYDTYP